MTEFTPVSGIVGGILLGSAVNLLLLFNGRITGISGFIAQPMFEGVRKHLWQVLFLAGLVCGALLFRLMNPGYTVLVEAPVGAVVIGGLCVGFGTRLAGGCTSGHGLCGNARLSRRSVVATLTFFASAMLTVFVIRHLMGGGS